MTTKEAAEKAKVSVRRIRALIEAKELKAEQHGRDWWITEKDLEKVTFYRKVGRPKEEVK